MFGSDWPVCTLRAPLAHWVSAARRIIASRSLADQGRMLDENAVRVYRLD
jgi:L-fuconolactonase